MRRLLALAFVAQGAMAHDHKPLPGVYSLDVARDGGALHLLVGENRAEGPSLWHRRSADEGRTWSEPVRVDAGLAAPRHLKRGDDAQVAASGNRLVAVWSTAGTGWMGSGPLATAISTDGGRTWRAGRNPADTGATTGHGFTELLAGEGGVHAVWLDSRDKAQGLRYARSKDFGASWEPNVTVAPGTCECCWNSLLESQGVLRVLYRGKGPRDMALATTRDGAKWEGKGRVGAFGWEFKGCPETGGGLAQTADGALHALVWTGSVERIGLHLLASRDGGAAWSAPRAMGGKLAQHADLAASGAALAAAWDAGGAIELSLSRDSGKTWTRSQQLAAADATHPRVVATASGFLALWTQREAGVSVLKTRAVAR